MKGMIKKFETSYVFHDTISRISSLLTIQENIEKINKKTQLPYIFTDKPYPVIFTYLLKENSCSEITSIISWIINSKEIPTSFTYIFTLSLNTIDNSTLLIFEIIINNPKKIEDKLKLKVVNCCNKICIEMINNIDILLQISNTDIFQYESDIINSSKEIIWNELKKINEHLKRGKKILDYKIEGNWEIGTKIFVKLSEDESYNFILTYIQNDINKKKWEIEISTLEKSLEKQAIRWCILEVSKNKSFIYVYHIFKELPPLEIMNELKLKKQKILKLIKDFIESLDIIK